MKFDKLPEELLANVPDEFYSWIKKTTAVLMVRYEFIKEYVEASHDAIITYLETESISAEEYDKTYALLALAEYKNISGLLFSHKKGKDIREAIWKKIKPAYERPFANKE
jgi:hypothetical protein